MVFTIFGIRLKARANVKRCGAADCCEEFHPQINRLRNLWITSLFCRTGSGCRQQVQLSSDFLKKPREMLVFLKTLPLECDISVCDRFTILVLVGGVTPDYGDQSRCRQEAHDPIGSNQPLL